MEKKSEALIVCATKNEYYAIIKAFKLNSSYWIDDFCTAHSSVGCYQIFCVCTGVGVENTIFCLNRFLQYIKPHIVIGFGTAGSINPNILPGELVTPLNIIRLNNLHSTEFIQYHPCLDIEKGIYIPVNMGTVDTFIHSRKKKESLINKSIDTIDCETYAISKFCIHNSIDYFIIRCITDHAGLLALVQYYWNENQILRKGAIALFHILNNSSFICRERRRNA